MLSSKLIYLIPISLLSLGLFIIINNHNYIKKIIGLAIFQNSVLIFYMFLSKVRNGVVPIAQCTDTSSHQCEIIYSNPLPHVLMLTAIVVGIATTSVSLAIIYCINKNFNSCNENEISLHIPITTLKQDE